MVSINHEHLPPKSIHLQHHSSFSPSSSSSSSIAQSLIPSPRTQLIPFLHPASLTAFASRSYTTPLSITANTNTHTSPPLTARHHLLFTPTFHALSTLILAEYRNTPRPPFRSSHAQKPAAKPPRKKRCVASSLLGSSAWKRQMLPQAVDSAPVKKVETRRARARMVRSARRGVLYRRAPLPRGRVRTV